MKKNVPIIFGQLNLANTNTLAYFDLSMMKKNVHIKLGHRYFSKTITSLVWHVIDYEYIKTRLQKVCQTQIL
jgi:hypothetical protein